MSEPYVMAKRGDLTCPVMRATASFHADDARCQSAEECQYLRPSNQRLAIIRNAMNLENRLGQVQPNYGNLLHGMVLSLCSVQRDHVRHLRYRFEGPFHIIIFADGRSHVTPTNWA